MEMNEIIELGLKEYWLIYDVENRDTIARAKNLKNNKVVNEYLKECDGTTEIIAKKMILNEKTGIFEPSKSLNDTKCFIYGKWN